MAANPPRGIRYRLVIRGEIGDHFSSILEGMEIERVAGTTVVTGNVVDQSHLLGLMEQIQELGLEVVSMQEDQPSPTEGSHRP